MIMFDDITVFDVDVVIGVDVVDVSGTDVVFDARDVV